MPDQRNEDSEVVAALAETLRREMAGRDWSVEKLAAESGVPFGSLRHYVKGTRAATLARFILIAEGLSMTAAALMAEVERRMAAGVTSRTGTNAVQGEGGSRWIGPDRRKDAAARAEFEKLRTAGEQIAEDSDRGSGTADR